MSNGDVDVNINRPLSNNGHHDVINNDVTSSPQLPSSLSHHIKIPSRPAPVPPLIPPLSSNNDSDMNDSQHSSSPTADDTAGGGGNMAVTFKLIPPTPEVDKTVLSYSKNDLENPSLNNNHNHTNSNIERSTDTLKGPPKRAAPPPPLDYTAPISPPLFTNSGMNRGMSPTGRLPSSSSPQPPEGGLSTLSELDVDTGPHAGMNRFLNRAGGGLGGHTLPRNARLSSSSSVQARGDAQPMGTPPATGVFHQYSSATPAGFDDRFRSGNDRYAEFGTLVSPGRRLRSQENLLGGGGFLTMQRAPPGSSATIGQVRAATLARINHDQSGAGFYSMQRGGGIPAIYGNPLTLAPPLEEEGQDMYSDEHKSIFAKYGSSKHISVAYCTLLTIISINLYMCQFYNPDMVKKATVHIFSILVYIMGIILVIFLISVFQFAKADPRVQSKDHRHCSVYLRGALILFCVFTSLQLILKIAYSMSKILDTCFEEFLPKVCDYALTVVFCYLEVYLIIVHSKLYISIQKLLVSISIAHLCFLNIYLIFTTVISQLDSQIDLVSIMNNQIGNKSATGPILSSVTVAAMKNITKRAVINTSSHQIICKNSTATKHLHDFSSKWSGYLYSFAVQFGILALSYLATLWCNVKSKSKRTPNRLIYNLGQRSKYFNCHHTSLGLILSLLVIILSATFIFLFSALTESDSYQKRLSMSYHVYMIILMIVMIGTFFKCIISFQQFNAKRGNHNILDRPLLIGSMIAIFVFYLFSIIACFGHFLSIANDILETILPTLSYTLCLLEALLQVIFLLDALKRQAGRRNDPSSRNYIVLLLGCNMALWALMLYRLGGADEPEVLSSIERTFYGVTTWKFVRTIAAPFVMLFYLHSTACFFDIWQFSFN